MASFGASQGPDVGLFGQSSRTPTLSLGGFGASLQKQHPFGGSSDNLFGSTYPHKDSNGSVPKATEIRKQNHSNAVLSDARVAAADCFDFKNDIIKVVAGSNESRTLFVVHKAVAAKRSPALLEFTEKVTAQDSGPVLLDFSDSSEQDAFDLAAVSPEVFKLYLHHAYTRQIPSKRDPATPDADAEHASEISLLCRFFAVAKAMRDGIAVKDALDAIYAKAHEKTEYSHSMLPSSEDIGVVYSATPGPCGARRLMVDLYVWKAAGTWVQDQVADGPSYPTEFLGDLAVALLKKRDDQSKTAVMDKTASEYYDID